MKGKVTGKKKITVQKVQAVFNEFVRRRDCPNGHGICISCGCRIELVGSTASHFFSAGNYKALRFNPENCWASCVKCNYFLSGNLLEYRKRLVEKIGIERVEKLELLAAASKRSVWKPMEYELKYIHDEFKTKIKVLKNMSM